MVHIAIEAIVTIRSILCQKSPVHSCIIIVLSLRMAHDDDNNNNNSRRTMHW